MDLTNYNTNYDQAVIEVKYYYSGLNRSAKGAVGHLIKMGYRSIKEKLYSEAMVEAMIKKMPKEGIIRFQVGSFVNYDRTVMRMKTETIAVDPQGREYDVNDAISVYTRKMRKGYSETYV